MSITMIEKAPTRPAGRLLFAGFVGAIGIAVAATAYAFVVRHEGAPVVASEANAAPLETTEASEPAVAQVVEPAAEEIETAETVARPAMADDGPRIALPKESARFAAPDEVPGDRVIDSGTTASISPDPAIEVTVAETEADVQAMETQLASADDTAFALPEDGTAEAGDIPMTEVRVLQWVNMRADADQGSEVLSVVPADERIQAQADCEGWCAVTYDGQDGYIYKDFLRY